MRECFQNLVRVKKCQDDGEGIKYLNDLGISLGKLADTANAAYHSGENLGNAKISEAIELILSDLKNYADTVDTLVTNKLGDTFNDETTSEQGIYIESNCTLARPFINFIKVKVSVDSDQTGNIKIIDGESQTVIDTREYVTGTNEFIIYPKYQTANDIVNIVFSGFTYQSAKCDINKYCEQPCYECRDDLYVTGWDNGKKGGCYGMQAGIDLKCMQDIIECQLCDSRSFQLSVWYLSGALILEELAYSDNFSEVTICKNKEDLQFKADQWRANVENLKQKVEKDYNDIVAGTCCAQCHDIKIVYTV